MEVIHLLETSVIVKTKKDDYKTVRNIFFETGINSPSRMSSNLVTNLASELPHFPVPHPYPALTKISITSAESTFYSFANTHQ